MQVLFGFFILWLLKTTILIGIGGSAGWIFRKYPGNIQAAIWTVILLLIWIVPIAERIVPVSVSLPAPNPVILPVTAGTQAAVNRFKPDREFHVQTPLGIQTDKKPGSIQETSGGVLLARGRETSVHTTNWKERIITAVIWFWLFGTGYSIAVWIRASRRIKRILQNARPVSEAMVISLVERTRQTLFINEKLSLCAADEKTAPFLYGFRKPVVFFPEFILRNWPEREQLAVIAHELAHVRRYDMIAHHGMRLLRILFWFWPPVWWMQRELHRAQDTACDECAAVVLGNNIEFGKALTELADYCLISNPVYPALGILHAKPSLLRRMENIMNTQLVHLSRLSLEFKFGITLVFCFLFLCVGTVKQTVFAQTAEIQYLGNYKGDKNSLGIEGMVYAEPYYALIGKQGDSRAIHLYSYSGGKLNLERIKFLNYSIPESEPVLEESFAQDGWIALFYKNSRQFYSWNYTDPSSEISCGILPYDNVYQILKDTEYLYMLVSKTNGNDKIYFICRWDLKTFKQKEYKFPEKIKPRTLAMIQGDFIFDYTVTDMSKPEDQPSIVRGQLSEDGQVIVDQKHWFAQASSSDSLSIDVYHYLYAQAPYLFYVKRTLNPDTTISSYSVSIVDWSNKDNPVTLQTIPCENGNALLYKNRMVIGKTVYSITNAQLEAKGTLDTNGYAEFIGPDLIGFSDNKVYQYNLTDITKSKSVVIPSMISETFSSIFPSGKYIYNPVLRNDGIEINIKDAAIPADMKTVKTLFVPGKFFRQMEIHNGLMSIVTELNGKANPVLYAVDKEGLVGNQINVPEIVGASSLTDYGTIVFNNKLYIQSTKIPVPNGHETPDPTYHHLYIYERDNGIIKPTAISDFSLDVKDEIIGLTDKYLFAKNSITKTAIIDGFERTVPQNVVNIYSVENPARPTLVSKIEIAGKSAFDTFAQMAYTNDYVAYQHPLYAGIVDIHDPVHPKSRFLDIPGNPHIRNLTFYRNVLFVSTDNMLSLYQINESGEDKEIGRISKTLSKPMLEENRIYNALGNLGVDIYSFAVGTTDIFNWKAY